MKHLHSWHNLPTGIVQPWETNSFTTLLPYIIRDRSYFHQSANAAPSLHRILCNLALISSRFLTIRIKPRLR